MVSSEAIARGSAKTFEMARFDERERPIVQQIFGSDPHVMAEAARLIEEKFRPDGIDVNMGCPAYKIASNFNGASLMREPERAAAIVRAMKSAVSVPISVKTRLGWHKDADILDFVKVIEDAGADLISIHGRTKEQGYSGQANWDRVGEARRNTLLPVLVNGDITSVEIAKDALTRSGADGMLIGRGALGNPWIFRELVAGLRDGAVSEPPTLDERVAVVREHARLHVEHYGERGLVTLRKHLPWYFKKELREQFSQIDFKVLRSKLVRVATLAELDGCLKF